MKRKVVLILWLFATMLSAEETGNEKAAKKKREELTPPLHEEITVTATTSPKAVKACASSVSVISEADLNKTSSASPLTLLGGLPGVFIQRTGDFGRSDVEIRGLGQRGQRVIVMTDGRPEKMGLFGCVVTHAFPLDNVSRIEVVRGPASVIHGSDALGGVVNIITRRPGQGFETDLRASYGAFDTQQFTLRHGAALDRWNYYVTYDRRSSDGHMPDSAYAGSQFTGRAGWKLSSNWEATLQGKYFAGKKNEPNLADAHASGSWNDYRRGALDLTFSGKWSRGDLQVKLYRDFGDHRFSDGWHSEDYVNGLFIRSLLHPHPRHELIVGADSRFFKGTSYAFPQGTWSRSESAVFAQDDYLIFRRLTLSAGLRLHHDANWGWEVVPQAGLVWTANDRLSLRASVSKGFRSPQLNELYMFPASNPDLRPERVWNREIGFIYAPTSHLLFSGSLFYMKGDNLIETAMISKQPARFKMINSGTFSFHGTEVGLTFTPFPLVSGSFFYTFLDPGEKTRGRPGDKFDLSLQINSDRLHAYFNLQHVSRYFADDNNRDLLPSYFLLNGRINLSITRFLDIFIDLNNMLDSHYLIYTDLPGTAAGGYPMPGRNLRFGVLIKP